jgi:molybdopterin synthase sulfur carrier subunit
MRARLNTMKITLHTILGIKQAIGQRLTEIELPPDSTVGDFISYMKVRWGEELNRHFFDPDTGTVVSYVRIMVNGRMIEFLEGMATTLHEGDEIVIIPPASGG